jgi:hypothetical protein
MANKPQQQKLNVKLDEKIGEGIYANFFMITHSPSEFVIDGGRIVPGLPSAKILSRMITTPQHAKQLMQLLKKNIDNYENQHGEIKLAGLPGDKNIGFKM